MASLEEKLAGSLPSVFGGMELLLCILGEDGWKEVFIVRRYDVVSTFLHLGLDI